jgi:nucleoside-diphosphate-sugar epimerase
MAVTRSDERAIELGMAELFTIGADVTKPESLECIRYLLTLGGPQVDCVLFAVGFDHTSGADIHTVYAQGLANVLQVLPVSVSRVIYISTTGVYGSGGGEWIDELTPPDPQRDGGRASLAAEKTLTDRPLGRNSIILRLAGIYGPGRIPFLEKLRAAEPIPAPVDGYLNLIHVDDAASVVIAADTLEPFDNGPRIYCVSDGHPVERGDYYREVARQIGAPPPSFAPPDPNSLRALRAAANRRVRNACMLNELRIKLTYADYRAGLSAALETQNQLGID